VRDAPEQPAGRDPQSLVSGLSDADLVTLGDRAFEGLAAAVLAVSGGADSLFLVVMAQRWRLARGRLDFPIHVATVDHGLRAAASAEAEWVAKQAEALGLPAHILVWSGEKPATAIQSAARTARYSLLSGLIERLELPCPTGLLVGHHLDDQAETFLMRLARGSGIDGLAAMQPERWLARDRKGVLRRPLLGLDKANITATLTRLGVGWLDDPSNANPTFERVRVRHALGLLQGLGVAADAIATSSRRLTRSRAALEHATRELARNSLDTHGGAYAEIKTAAFDAAPEEIRLRLLQHVLRLFGAGGDPVRLVQLEDLADRMAAGVQVAATLGGCHMERSEKAVIAMREPGRLGLPVLILAPGDEQIWDNRFRVSCAAGHPGPVEVRALTADMLSQIQKRIEGTEINGGAMRPTLPRRAALTLPAFWRGDRLLAVPHPAMVSAGDGSLRAEFFDDFSKY